MQDVSDDAFGFEAVGSSARDKIKQIRPSVPVNDIPDLTTVDAVAEKVGFVSRELPEQPDYNYQKLKPRPEPRIPLNMRVPVSLGGSVSEILRGEPLQLS